MARKPYQSCQSVFNTWKHSCVRCIKLYNLHFPEPDSDCVLLVLTLNETTIMEFIRSASKLERNVHVGYVRRSDYTNPAMHYLASYTLPATIIEYFPFQRLLSFLWYMKGVSLFEIHAYEQILLFGELIPS